MVSISARSPSSVLGGKNSKVKTGSPRRCAASRISVIRTPRKLSCRGGAVTVPSPRVEAPTPHHARRLQADLRRARAHLEEAPAEDRLRGRGGRGARGPERERRVHLRQEEAA